jgi:hypothetical protein
MKELKEVALHIHPIGEGGTGQITAQAALDALAGGGTAGNDSKALIQDTDHKIKLMTIPINTTAFTPTGTSDTSGLLGDIKWDDSNVYIKTSAGWKKSALSTF